MARRRTNKGMNKTTAPNSELWNCCARLRQITHNLYTRTPTFGLNTDTENKKIKKTKSKQTINTRAFQHNIFGEQQKRSSNLTRQNISWDAFRQVSSRVCELHPSTTRGLHPNTFDLWLSWAAANETSTPKTKNKETKKNQ